jgi:glycosyltransferase involved in cell wall biosynthesis
MLVIAALPLVALTITVINCLTWPRGRTAHPQPANRPCVSVLIPARNEVDNLVPLIRSITRQTVRPAEIVVYDDASTDGTDELLARLESEVPELVVLRGNGLPEGWVGKPHACHQLASAARGSLFLFVDADVRLAPSGIERITEVRHRYSASVVTAVPRQRVVTTLERLVVPLLHLTYLAWLPLFSIWRTRNPSLLAANGQLLLVDRETYESTGGFESVRDAIVDDMAFCRNAKASGHRVVFADGHDMAECRMYRSASEVWSGFSKNIYLGVGARPGRLALALSLNLLTFVLPLLTLVGALTIPALGPADLAAIGGGAVLATTLLVAVRHRYPPSTTLVLPLGVVCLTAIGMNSFRWHLEGRIRWRDRVYGSALSSTEIAP